MADGGAARRPLVLVGGGGHCRACIDVIEATAEWDILGILDLPERQGERVSGYSIIGSDADIAAFAARDVWFLVAIGQIRTANVRRGAYQAIKAAGGHLATVISPLAYVSRSATVGEGSIVMHRALVNAGARVGSNVIVNTMALIEHDAAVGDCCHVATGAVVNGGAKIGSGTFIGSNAVIIQAAVVEDDALIPAATLFPPRKS